MGAVVIDPVVYHACGTAHHQPGAHGGACGNHIAATTAGGIWHRPADSDHQFLTDDLLHGHPGPVRDLGLEHEQLECEIVVAVRLPAGTGDSRSCESGAADCAGSLYVNRHG